MSTMTLKQTVEAFMARLPEMDDPDADMNGGNAVEVLGEFWEQFKEALKEGGKDTLRPSIEWRESLCEVGPYDETDDLDKPRGGLWTKLLGQIEIAGVPHHIEGWAVTTDEAGYQEPVSSETNFDDMMNMTEGAGVTVEINGHEYFMVVTPHQL